MKTNPILKLLIILCTLIFLFTACKKSHYYQLAPEDLAWIVYSEGDIIKFRNPAGNIKTFKAYHKTRSYTVSDNNYYEESGISFELVNDTTESRGLLYIVKNESGNLITLTWPRYSNKLIIS